MICARWAPNFLNDLRKTWSEDLATNKTFSKQRVDRHSSLVCGGGVFGRTGEHLALLLLGSAVGAHNHRVVTLVRLQRDLRNRQAHTLSRY